MVMPASPLSNSELQTMTEDFFLENSLWTWQSKQLGCCILSRYA